MKKGIIILLSLLSAVSISIWFNCNPLQDSLKGSTDFNILDETDFIKATASVTVAKSGGDYTTVSAALNAVSSGTTINIKNGTYNEKITVSKSNITFIGESSTSTILTYSDSSSSAGGTVASASVTVSAAGFIAQNIYFKNDFDYDNSSVSNKQAAAVVCKADQAAFYNCRFHSHQDTLCLWSGTGRQYFENCYIEGHTDYIFGNGTGLFYNCTIHSLTKSGASICAPSTYASTSYGIIFMNCTIEGGSNSSGSVYLGRPWHPSSEATTIKSMAVYFKCSLGSFIQSAGWTSMSGVSPSTERMYEYQNTGSGANSSRTQLSSSAAANYTVSNILNGWNP